MFALLAHAGWDLLRFLFSLFRSQARLVAENIALRSQSEVCATCRHPRRHLRDAKKVAIVLIDHFFGIRHDLPLLTPGTVRACAARVSTRLFWLRAAKPGRPPLPERAIAVIRQFANENPLWKIREIAKKSSAYLGLRISPGFVRRCLPLGDPRRRLIGTMRRECIDWIIPFGEEQLRRFVREWATHYYRARPHLSLDYGVPEPNEHVPAPPSAHRHRLPDDARVVATPILGGLSHEYRLDGSA